MWAASSWRASVACTSTGNLSARTKVGARWAGYKKIAGTGDLNGGGRADLASRDAVGNGKGVFSAGTRIATGFSCLAACQASQAWLALRPSYASRSSGASGSCLASTALTTSSARQ